jgi:hypothetical protein
MESVSTFQRISEAPEGVCKTFVWRAPSFSRFSEGSRILLSSRSRFPSAYLIFYLNVL